MRLLNTSTNLIKAFCICITKTRASGYLHSVYFTNKQKAFVKIIIYMGNDINILKSAQISTQFDFGRNGSLSL
jgi:hypothetical protein